MALGRLDRIVDSHSGERVNCALQGRDVEVDRCLDCADLVKVSVESDTVTVHCNPAPARDRHAPRRLFDQLFW
jgi:hypothetical protein